MYAGVCVGIFVCLRVPVHVCVPVCFFVCACMCAHAHTPDCAVMQCDALTGYPAMDQLLPSPGFSIPSIGTPLPHSGEEEMILLSAQQKQQQQSTQEQQQQSSQQQQPQGSQMGQQQQQQGSQMGQQQFSSGLTPHTLLQPHTPVSIMSFIYSVLLLCFS